MGKGAKSTSGCIVYYHGMSTRCVVAPLRAFISTSEVSAKPNVAARGGVLDVSFLTIIRAERRLGLSLAVTGSNSAEENM